jgi:hypothetical protein
MEGLLMGEVHAITGCDGKRKVSRVEYGLL